MSIPIAIPYEARRANRLPPGRLYLVSIWRVGGDGSPKRGLWVKQWGDDRVWPVTGATAEDVKAWIDAARGEAG